MCGRVVVEGPDCLDRCYVCGVDVPDADWLRHNDGARHATLESAVNGFGHRCSICGGTYEDYSLFVEHYGSSRHRRAEKRAEKKAVRVETVVAGRV